MNWNLVSRSVTAILLLSLLYVLAIRCAHPLMPSGGPKDIIPPQLVSSDPENYSVSFDRDKIIIVFDEFIELKDHFKEIFISPPFYTAPEFKVKGKQLVIDITEELKPNTTYTIYFGNAITDLTEGNPKSNFEFVFSTGTEIDSLSVTGEVLNAFTLIPEKDIVVMLYLDDNDTIPLDSLPLLVRPLSASRTNEDGFFFLNNLRKEQFKIFALQDANNNFIYDLPNEQIAFLDSLVQPEYLAIIAPDTALSDSVQTEKPIAPVYVYAEPEQYYSLFLFDEHDSVQRLLDTEVVGKNRVMFMFRYPVAKLAITTLDTLLPSGWKLEEYSRHRDTLTYWLREHDMDTLIVEVRTDTIVLDTITFSFKKARGPRPGRKKDKTPEYLTIRSNARSGIVELDKGLNLVFSAPAVRFFHEKISLAEAEDTLSASFKFLDTVQRHAYIDHTWKEGEKYSLLIMDSAFTDIRGLANDTTIIPFMTRSKSDYGSLTVNISFPESGGQFIIMLMGAKENILKQEILRIPGPVYFDYLLPGRYTIKAIADINRNGRWDTGEYLLKRQAESVFYAPIDIDIRANWDLIEEWYIDYQ